MRERMIQALSVPTNKNPLLRQEWPILPIAYILKHPYLTLNTLIAECWFSSSKFPETCICCSCNLTFCKWCKFLKKVMSFKVSIKCVFYFPKEHRGRVISPYPQGNVFLDLKWILKTMDRMDIQLYIDCVRKLQQ